MRRQLPQYGRALSHLVFFCLQVSHLSTRTTTSGYKSGIDRLLRVVTYAFDKIRGRLLDGKPMPSSVPSWFSVDIGNNSRWSTGR